MSSAITPNFDSMSDDDLKTFLIDTCKNFSATQWRPYQQLSDKVAVDPNFLTRLRILGPEILKGLHGHMGADVAVTRLNWLIGEER